jgi:hypothetical protein
MTRQSESTFNIAIYIGGDIGQAKQVCREHCMRVGLCVTVEPVSFIYTGGEESGVRVGLINYPRFPAKPSAILAKASALADELQQRLCQHSYSIVTPTETIWASRREEDSCQ